MAEVQKQLELEAECNAKSRASRPASLLTAVVKLEKEDREHGEHGRALRAEEEGEETEVEAPPLTPLSTATDFASPVRSTNSITTPATYLFTKGRKTGSSRRALLVGSIRRPSRSPSSNRCRAPNSATS
ncbi:hypothetical protein TB2_012687 [Malus domestica]